MELLLAECRECHRGSYGKFVIYVVKGRSRCRRSVYQFVVWFAWGLLDAAVGSVLIAFSLSFKPEVLGGGGGGYQTQLVLTSALPLTLLQTQTQTQTWTLSQ